MSLGAYSIFLIHNVDEVCMCAGVHICVCAYCVDVCVCVYSEQEMTNKEE